ncbi:translation initiation factor eIF 4e-like domain-containing protein [Linnemannia elongata]|nr:translation initiation factor eIF 4e-like domain-containing protein [Linnemannia elongata]
MRRTASHNNAFSSGLGVPVSVGASTGHINGSAHNGASHTDGSNGPSQTALSSGLSSPVLAPFSLGQMTRSTSLRRSSLNPQDPGTSHHQDHASPSQTSGLSPSMADKHPLQHPWTLYYDTAAGYNRGGSSMHNYETGLRDMGTFTTVEQFARYFNWIKKPHKIENSANYHLFKDGIKPMWEDPANASGGRWTVTLLTKNPELLDRCWMELAYALVGEQLDLGDDICGAVLSRRTKADRLAVWVRDKDNVEAINGIGKRLIKFLDLAEEKISLEFQVCSSSASRSVFKDTQMLSQSCSHRSISTFLCTDYRGRQAFWAFEELYYTGDHQERADTGSRTFVNTYSYWERNNTKSFYRFYVSDTSFCHGGVSCYPWT